MMNVRAHLLSASNPATIWSTLHEARYAIDPRYLPRFAAMLAFAVPVSAAGAVERALYHRWIAETKLAAPPIFILGHWRSGTTHIHNVLSQDPQLGFLSTYDALLTNNGVVGRSVLKHLARVSTPEKRPMDGMAVGMDLPQEEEYGLLNLSPLSYYKQYVFPGRSDDYARRHIFFDDVPPHEIDAWKRHYDFLLRKITWLTGPRPLVLKNPPNTARLRYLLELYPDARVVYLYRDPCEVYLSTLRMREKMFELVGLQAFDRGAASEHILATYPRMIERFFADLPRVRPGRFVAVRYQDLKHGPLATIERVYGALDLPGFGAARERFARYLDEVADFEPARYAPDPATVRMVEARWGAAHALHDTFA